MKNGYMKYFGQQEDTRVQGRVLHPMENIFMMTIVAVFCGFEEWEDIADFAEYRRDFFAKYLDLENGTPSADTFSRFFQKLDPKVFQKVFAEWAHTLVGKCGDKTVSIDGKRICTASRINDEHPLHIVSAWVGENQAVLGQIKVNDKSNEITAIPMLLDILDIKEGVVTIDAMGTQTDIAAKIVGKDADYVLAVKDNQQTLRDDVSRTFEAELPFKTYEEEDFGHGRIEHRKYSFTDNLDRLLSLERWDGLAGLVKVERTSIEKKTGKTTCDMRYFITSLSDERKAFQAVREHWGVESMHWQLDVLLGEDRSLKRAGNSAENFNMIRKMVINLMRNDDYEFPQKRKKKKSLGRKMMSALFDPKYLEHLISKL